MHWHILGAGSIGCLWAAQLCAAGYPVTLIARNEQRRIELGQRVRLEQGEQISNHTVDVVSPISCGAITHLLITTKAYDACPALTSIRSHLMPGATLVMLHNGMGPQHQVLNDFPQQTVWAGTTTDGAWLRASGHVVFAGQGETWLGRLDAGDDSSLPEQLQGLALTLNHDADIAASLWRKLAINCAINPLTALHQCRNGELCSNPDYNAEMKLICEEIDQLFSLPGYPQFPEGLFNRACQVATATAQNYSSMQQDLQFQRPTEIDFITGFLCQEARKAGLTLHQNERLLSKIKKIC